MLTLEEAQARLLGLAKPLAHENTALNDALGRYLAEPLVAARTQPAADLSAMDGYATQKDDTTGPWTIIGESAAGHPFVGTLKAGEAVRISTGAVMPQGAGAVLLQENAARDGNALSLTNADGREKKHIRRAGFDFASGDDLLPAGAYLGPAQLALARMAGHNAVAVHRRPSLTVIDCGDELVAEPADASGPNIPATNGAMLGAMVDSLVSHCARVGPLPDSLDALTAVLDSADSDVVVLSGGASVGDHDLVKPALELAGAKLTFWRVSMKPGKPLLVAAKGNQIILGLPGNPVSAYVTAFCFVLPLLRLLGGSRDPMPRSVQIPLAAPLPPGGTRTEFIRGRFTAQGALPIEQRDSSAIRSLAEANLLIRREIGVPEAPIGANVTVYPIQNGGIA